MRFMATVMRGYDEHLLPVQAPSVEATDVSSLFDYQGTTRIIMCSEMAVDFHELIRAVLEHVPVDFGVLRRSIRDGARQLISVFEQLTG